MNQQKTCPGCGENLAEDAAVCPACGKPVPIAAPPPALPQDGVHKLNWWVDILIFFLSLGAGFVAVTAKNLPEDTMSLFVPAVCSVVLGVRMTYRMQTYFLLKVFLGIVFTAVFFVVTLVIGVFFGCVFSGPLI